MNKFGMQFDEKLSNIVLEERELSNKSTDYEEIKDVLRRIQLGYSERAVEKVDDFVKELFISGEDKYILGTGTGELCLGTEQVKTLVEGDWEYWEDVNIDWEQAYIECENNVAWFAANGSVKQSFEDTTERYESYVNFIKDKIEDPELTPKQKITFVNWVLTLTYHQRFEKKREYFIPLRLSGVLLKDDTWKISQLHFSLPKGDFPDERFEDSKEFLENFEKHNAIAASYANNNFTEEIKSFMRSFEEELIGEKSIIQEHINKFFTSEKNPFIIAPENKWYVGIDQIKEYFTENNGFNLSLDLDHAISTEASDVIWVTVSGTLHQRATEDELATQVLNDFGSLLKTNLSAKEKLFITHRNISYALKEAAVGVDYTCPIRLTAVILRHNNRLVFHNIHFSYPSYWIFEGKIDNIDTLSFK